jgi:hypothetical protein
MSDDGEKVCWCAFFFFLIKKLVMKRPTKEHFSDKIVFLLHASVSISDSSFKFHNLSELQRHFNFFRLIVSHNNGDCLPEFYCHNLTEIDS